MAELKIWEIRTERNITLVKLAKMTGISKTTINNIENGKVSPRLDQLELLAAALKVDIGDIIVSNNKKISAYTEIVQGCISIFSNMIYNADKERAGGKVMKDDLIIMIHHMLEKLNDDEIIAVYNFVHYLFIA